MNEEDVERLKARVKEAESAMGIHQSYSERTGREPDFEVEYSLNPKLDSLGIKPGQGMRSDFLYDGDDPKIQGVHMIHPELLDQAGNPIIDKSQVIDRHGKAFMWIIDRDTIDFHQTKIEVGVKASWVTGPYKIADVIVTEILGLKGSIKGSDHLKNS